MRLSLTVRLLWGVAIVLLPTAGVKRAIASFQAQRTADVVLKELAESYASLPRYNDRGVVRTTLTDKNLRVVATTRFFKTQFVRGKRLEFTYGEKPDLARSTCQLVWTSGDATLRSTSGRNAQRLPLSDAVGAATIITEGVAQNIPRLLIGEQAGGSPITELSDSHITRSEKVAGEDCVAISGRLKTGDELQLWVNPTAKRLVRVMSKSLLQGYVGQSTITYSVSP